MTEVKDIVEPLVDALTHLIVECISGSMKDVTNHCMKLASSTQSLVDLSQQVALKSDDPDLTNEIINAINFIADQIEGLVVAFTQLIQNRDDHETVTKFSNSAQNVADAINSLVIVTDDTSQKRMTSLIRKSMLSHNSLDATIDSKNRAEFIAQSAQYKELHERLYDVCNRASIATKILKKKELLTEGSNLIHTNSQKFPNAIKAFLDEPNNQNAFNHYDGISKILMQAYKLLVSAVKIDEDSSFAKIRELVKAITDLILHAKKLHGSSGELIIAITNDAPLSERSAIAKRVHTDAQNVIKNAKIVADSVTDPTIKKLILNSIEDITASLDDLLRIANLKEISPAEKAKAANSFETLMNSVQKIVTASRTDASDSYPVHLTSEVLVNAVNGVIEAAKRQDIDGVNKKSQEVNDLSNLLIDILKKKAESTNDPNEKKYLLEAAELLKNSVADVLEKSRLYANNPSIENAKALENAKQVFKKAIDRARGVEGTPDGFLTLPSFETVIEEEKREPVVVQPQQFNFDFEELASDDALVKAAKEQARAALDVIREAEKYLTELDHDPVKQQNIRDTSNLVRELASKVVEAAKRAAENPDDPEAQKAMEKYQAELASAIAKLLGLTGKQTKEVTDALKDLNEALIQEKNEANEDSGNAALANEFFKIADTIISTILKNFDQSKPTDVHKGVEIAREIAVLSTKANKSLIALGNTVKADSFKSQIVNAGKIISDNALKLKILAAVKVSGGDDNTGQVASAANGLSVQVQEIVSQLKAGFLRHRVQATAKQTLALKRIAEAVRKARYA